jgi:hypothetical protein
LDQFASTGAFTSRPISFFWFQQLGRIHRRPDAVRLLTENEIRSGHFRRKEFHFVQGISYSVRSESAMACRAETPAGVKVRPLETAGAGCCKRAPGLVPGSSGGFMRFGPFLLIALLLFILWMGGFVFFHVAGFLIHLLLIFAVISLVVHFFTGSKTA